ncbi:MAG: CHAP domain-containing protein [Acidocella sp.]|nr:CHAP domain-containing protein [Acidocella sp.]
MMGGKYYARVRARQIKLGLFSVSLLAISGLFSHPALADVKTTSHSHVVPHHYIAHKKLVPVHHLATIKSGPSHIASTAHQSPVHLALNSHRHYHLASARYRHSMLQCVPYAREVSHIELTGNAFLWWAEASGRYARGNNPAEGAVLNFRPTRHMPLGHVAVVTAVIDSRTILTTQANWIPGTITNDVTMEDVSPNNDWSMVQVELGDTASMGASYPTYGFIYNQPDTATTIASNASTAAPASEVAEAPKLDPLANDAPNRNLQ